MYAKHKHAWIYRSIRVLWRVWWAKPSDASDASRFARICLAPPTLVHLSPGATPQGNVAREDERCSDLSFDVEAVRESGGEDGKRRRRHVGKIGRHRYGYLGQLWPGSQTRPQMNYR